MLGTNVILCSLIRGAGYSKCEKFKNKNVILSQDALEILTNRLVNLFKSFIISLKT